MNYLTVLAAITGIIGVFMVIAPKFFVGFNSVFNKVIFTDADFFSTPKLSGAFFILIGCILELAGYRFRSMSVHVWEYEQGATVLFYVFMILGIISIILGLIFIFKPLLLVKLSEVGNRVVFSERVVYSNPRFFGIILIVLSAFIFYLYIIRQ